MITLAVFSAVCLVSGVFSKTVTPAVVCSKEYSKRLDIFKENSKDNNRNVKYPETVFAVNSSLDLKSGEREQDHRFKPLNETRVKVAPDRSMVLPVKFDWRDKGVVSHAKEQGACPCSFIFSAIGNIEGQYNIKHNKSLAFSDSQALDCLRCGTCSGGYPHKVMQEFSQRAGIMKEEDYPFIGQKWTCLEEVDKVVAHVLGGQEIDIPDEDTLMQKLVEIGPLAVGLANDDLDDYRRGILYPQQCTGRKINEYMLLVGYGEENWTKYWILKSSRGDLWWGEDGYLRLVRGVNACQMGTGYTASATVA